MAKNFNNRPANTVNTDFYNPYTFVELNNDNYVMSLDSDEEKDLDFVHDIPFENGYSGKIQVEFESMTKFCVLGSGEHHTNVNNRYYVPGSSIKGMLRSITEMITFANMKNGIEDNRYSMRDLTPGSPYELKNGEQRPGFLFKVNGKYYIQETTARKVSYSEMEDMIEGFASKRDSFERAKDISTKYALINNKKFMGDNGIWFFSGSMKTKNPAKSKQHEYLFSIPSKFSDSAFVVDETDDETGVFDDFVFIHEKENPNSSWNYWKEKVSKKVDYNKFDDVSRDGIVPVFFREEDGEIIDFGLSYLYRQPYYNTVHDLLPKTFLDDENELDLVQGMFGFVNVHGKSLKGRIVVGNAMLDESIRPDGKAQTFIMGAPKPTFYPFYIEQKGNKKKTYFDDDAKISGYKRYLIRDNAIESRIPRSNTTSTFYPMPEHTIFSTEIYFHNLKDYELGALLCAITFNKNQDKCFHSLGYAKPFGYGKIKVNRCALIEKDLQANDEKNNGKDIEFFYKAFDTLIDDCGIRKIFDKVISDLKHISSGNYVSKVGGIRYPKTGMETKNPNEKNNEFVAIKKSNLNINDFSPIK